MSKIIKQDSNGVKPLLAVGEFGYDNYPEGGDIGRVYVGNGSENIPQAKKAEVVTVDGKVDTHVARIDNPHSVTKAQVGLGSVDNTSDANKPISTYTQNALDLKQNVLVSGSNIKTIEGQSIVGSGNIDLTKTDVGLSNVDNTADSAKVVASAGKWTTARTLSLTGGITGSVSIDGSDNASIVTTVAANSVALGTDTTGNYVAGNTAGTGIVVTGTAGEGWSPTIALSNVGTAGTYRSVTTNAQGRVTSGTNPTTVTGYGLTDVYTKTEVNSLIPTTLPASDVYAWAKVATKPTYTASEVGLGNVTNESKSTMFTSPTFTGTPVAGTAAVGTNTTQVATTAFVNAEIANDAIPRVVSTDNAIVRFDGTTGEVQNSGVIIDDNGNVGIDTSSPANSKFGRTLTTQATGVSSVAITAGDYSSTSRSIVTAVESLGSRNDANGSFGGRFGASYRRSDGVAIPSGNTIGYYAFGGQWGTDVGYTPSKHLYAASICGISEGSFTSASAMATGIAFRTGSVGQSLGDVNTTYGTERMRIDSNGNVLVTGSGGLGYGTGSGGTVTQLTSKTTAVTLNKPSGHIITSSSTLGAGVTTAFILNNTLLTGNDNIKVIVGGGGAAGAYQADCTYCINGAANITIKNLDSTSRTDAVSINFTIIKGASS